VAGYVPFEAAACFAGGFALAGSFVDVSAGFGADPGSGDDDGVEGLMLLWLSN